MNISADTELRSAIAQAKTGRAVLGGDEKTFERLCSTWNIRTIGHLADKNRINMRVLRQVRLSHERPEALKEAMAFGRTLLEWFGCPADHLQD